MKKKYKLYKVTSVKLDPDQALLHACAVGGIYIWTQASAQTHCSTQSFYMGIGPRCELTAKGAEGNNMTMRYTLPATQTEASFPS